MAMIVGLIGEKLGMTHIFDVNGHYTPVTVVKAGPCFVTQIKSPETDGYSAVQIGYREVKAEKLSDPEAGHLKNSLPLRLLREFRVDGQTGLSVGDRLGIEQFREGQELAITATSKGKGFAGVMKRHGFKGGPRTHGQSDRNRAPGSIGAGTTPGRVYKGMRMAGRMGNERVTVRGVKVVRLDPERGLVLLKGAVPGRKGGIVLLRPVGA